MERSKKNRGKDEKAHSETDRYKHDMQQALAMRAGLGKRGDISGIENSSQNYLLQDDGVSLGLLALDEADGLRKNEQYESAFDLYQRGIELLIKYLRDTTLNGPVDHITLQARVAEALSNAEALKEIIRRKQQKPLITQRQPDARVDLILDSIATFINNLKISSESNNSKVAKRQTMARKSREGTKPARVVQSMQNSPTSRVQTNRQTLHQLHDNAICNDPLTQTIMSDLYVNTSRQPTTWNDIAGLTAVKQSLQESAILPLIRPDLFTGLRKPQNILLWGPPGTGKTLLVRAVSYESQSSLFVCTASGITSKWHGEGEKLVRALFSVAKQKSPSIIFIDEMDALLAARKSDGEHEASRRFKTEFMVQMDGIVKDENSSNKHVLLLACTNCPWDVDSAVLRRFSRRIYVSLPSKSARLPLIEKLLQKAGKNTLTADEIAKLVKKTRGFSCADITSIASEAAFEPLRSLGSLNAIRGVNERDVRPISMSDFEKTIAKATKSVSPELIKRYEEWSQQQSAG